MLHIKKIASSILLAGVLFSCGKDEIEVIKNLDTSWTVDQSIVDSDIRTRVGYDPRYGYAYFKNASLDAPMLSMDGVDLAINGTSTYQVEVNTTAPLKETAKLAIEYDASAFESLQSAYPDYELGDASLVKVVKAETTIAQGTSSGTFEISVENDASIEKSYILPFTVKITQGGEQVKLYEDAKTFVVKIFPKKIAFSVVAVTDKVNIVRSRRTGAIKVDETNVEFFLGTKTPIPAEFSVGLVRDDSESYGYSLAPAGVEGTLPKQSVYNGTEFSFSFELQNIEEKFTEYGTYVIPLKWVIYDTSGTAYDLPLSKSLVTITVEAPGLEENLENSKGSNTEAVPDGKQLFRYNVIPSWYKSSLGERSSNSEVRRLLSDGNNDAYVYFRANEDMDQGLVFRLYIYGSDTGRKLKTVRIKMSPEYSTNKIQVLASEQVTGNTSWVNQGVATFEEGKDYYVITFEEAISANRILLRGFERSTGDRFEVSEVECYLE